jgi:hypothetical protein
MASLFQKLFGRRSLSDPSMEDCTSCKATFATAREANPSSSRAAKIDEAQPVCRCQNYSVSEFSSGPVGSDEVLIRVLVAPQHMDKKKGLPKAAALSDAERSGLSVFREHQATDDEIRRVAEGLVKTARAAQGDKAGVFGVLRMPCATVRACRAEAEDTPAYCVYDTAEKHIPSHAETFQRVHGVDDGLRDERRKLLYAAVKSEFVAVDKFRNGLLADLAPKSGSNS